ncbi:MAG: hypothetical protein E1N59_3152 [Puniceicoccaceae bacterium 5H]|nr:MAG: hypothetical protein E1N59_3152 [Puniceicoccaceae bacterium 5H]
MLAYQDAFAGGRRAELHNQLSDALAVILLQTDLLQDDQLTVDLAHETALEIRRSVQQMRSLLRYL